MQKRRSEIASSSDTPKTTTQPCWPSVAKNKWKQINKQQGSNSPRQPRPSMKHSVSIFSWDCLLNSNMAQTAGDITGTSIWMFFFFNTCKYIPDNPNIYPRITLILIPFQENYNIHMRFLWAFWERIFQNPLHMCKWSQRKFFIPFVKIYQFPEAKQKSTVHGSMIVKDRAQLWQTESWKQ